MSAFLQIVTSAPEILPGGGILAILVGLSAVVYGMSQVNRNTLMAASLFGFVGNGVVVGGMATALSPDKPFIVGLANLPSMVWALAGFLAIIGSLVLGMAVANTLTSLAQVLGTIVANLLTTLAELRGPKTVAKHRLKPAATSSITGPLQSRPFTFADAAAAHGRSFDTLTHTGPRVPSTAPGTSWHDEVTVAFPAGSQPVEIGHYLLRARTQGTLVNA